MHSMQINANICKHMPTSSNIIKQNQTSPLRQYWETNLVSPGNAESNTTWISTRSLSKKKPILFVQIDLLPTQTHGTSRILGLSSCASKARPCLISDVRNFLKPCSSPALVISNGSKKPSGSLAPICCEGWKVACSYAWSIFVLLSIFLFDYTISLVRRTPAPTAARLT